MNRRDAVNAIGKGVAVLAASGPDALSRAPAQPEPILTRPIPSSGEPIPVIGVGTWQTFDVGASAAERAPLEAVLSSFVELGGKVIDSSPMYGNSEGVVGDISARLGLRAKLFVATKVWTSGKQRGIAQMDESMKKLRTSVVDLMQVHNLVDVATHLATLRDWKRAGRVRYIGVTHYTAGALDDVARVVTANPVDFIQINYSVGERDAERRLLPLARRGRRRSAARAGHSFSSSSSCRIRRSPARSPAPAKSSICATTCAPALDISPMSHSARGSPPPLSSCHPARLP